MNKKYTRKELIDELHRYYTKTGKTPLTKDMTVTNGFIGIDNYYREFESWSVALQEAGFTPSVNRYTNEMLIKYLHDFFDIYNVVPTCKDFRNNKDYPGPGIFKNHFGSWNSALKAAGFNIHKSWHKNSKDDKCSICEAMTTTDWYLHTDNTIICSKCHSSRYYYKGTLDPNCSTATGIITEHIVYLVLNDCIKCNTDDNFNAEYDLVSKQYGVINVKSAMLRRQTRNRINWGFMKKVVSSIPDHYICIGFNEDKTEILHVWIISGTSTLVTKRGIHIALRRLERASQYEVDATLYNEVYQNLDIYTLPEFCNLPRIDMTNGVPPNIICMESN